MKEEIKILNEFYRGTMIRNYSKGTIYEYNIRLKIFFNFLIEYYGWGIDIKDINIFFLKQVNSETISAFLTYLALYKNLKASTRRLYLAILKVFFKWLYIKYDSLLIGQTNPLNSEYKIGKVLRLPKYLSINDGIKIQSVFNKTNSVYPERNNAIITLFLNTGIRLSELVNIDLKDIDFENKCIKNVICKGNKERIVYINDKIIQRLNEYLNTRADNFEALFISSHKKRISRREVEDICKKAFSILGLEDHNFTTHTLRHTAATQLYSKTKDILLVKEFLGHASLKATEIYSHTINDAVRNAVESNPLSNYLVQEEGVKNEGIRKSYNNRCKTYGKASEYNYRCFKYVS